MPELPEGAPGDERAGRRPLTWRVVAVIVAITAAALVLSGAVAVTLIRRSVTETTTMDVQRQAEQLAGGIADIDEVLRRGANRQPQGRFADRPTESRQLAGLVRAVFAGLFQGEAAGVYEVTESGLLGPALARGPSGPTDQDVVNVADVDVAALAAGLTQTGTATFEGKDYAWAADLTSFADADVVVVIAAPIESTDLAAAASLAIAGVVALVIAAFVSILLAKWLTRPVVSLTAAVAAVSKGDYSSRVDDSRRDEIGELAHAFNSMADELQRARTSERSFLMLVSHDLRTPLTSIKGYAEAIADGAVSGNGAKRAANVIGGETDRLGRLVEDLLDLARLEAHEFALRYEAVDLGIVLSELAAAYEHRFAEVGLGLDAGGEQIPVFATDPDRVEQLVRNLLENALRYVPSGRTVSLRWSRPDSRRVQIDVSDTGDGIAADDLPHVFERLYMAGRYRDARKSGTGLGLAIVSQLTAALGGEVTVSSEVGVGTTFTVTLPTG